MLNMDLINYLYENYGYDEPILSKELYEDLDMNPNTLRQCLKRGVDRGNLCRYKYKDGIYFIPNPNSLLKNKTINFNKIISKEYLFKKGKRIGYVTGLSFANQLQLTTQNPVRIEIVTQNETTTKREVNYKIRRVTLRKPRVKEINESNYKILQVFDLLNNFDKLSVEPIEIAIDRILNYLSDITIDNDELNYYLKNYPRKAQIKVLENDINYELTSK